MHCCCVYVTMTGAAAGSLPRSPGTYLLILHCTQRDDLRFGVRGRMRLQPGYYLYTGSAFGPGGLHARLGRHLAGNGKCRWHIDYLRQVTDPLGAWYVSDARVEHDWALTLAQLPGILPAQPGFGSSDCNCATHLFYSTQPPEPEEFSRVMGNMAVTVCMS